MITPSGPSSGGSLFKRVSGAVSLKDPTDSFDVPTGRTATVVVAAADSMNKEAADFICTGTTDYLQVALDALPAIGGKIQLLDGTFDPPATVSRNIDNVIIAGSGLGTKINYNDSSPVFDAGVQSGWAFRDLSTDAGGIDIASATKWKIESCLLGTDFISLRTTENIDVGWGNADIALISDDYNRTKYDYCSEMTISEFLAAPIVSHPDNPVMRFNSGVLHRHAGGSPEPIIIGGELYMFTEGCAALNYGEGCYIQKALPDMNFTPAEELPRWGVRHTAVPRLLYVPEQEKWYMTYSDNGIYGVFTTYIAESTDLYNFSKVADSPDFNVIHNDFIRIGDWFYITGCVSDTVWKTSLANFPYEWESFTSTGMPDQAGCIKLSDGWVYLNIDVDFNITAHYATGDDFPTSWTAHGVIIPRAGSWATGGFRNPKPFYYQGQVMIATEAVISDTGWDTQKSEGAIFYVGGAGAVPSMLTRSLCEQIGDMQKTPSSFQDDFDAHSQVLYTGDLSDFEWQPQNSLIKVVSDTAVSMEIKDKVFGETAHGHGFKANITNMYDSIFSFIFGKQDSNNYYKATANAIDDYLEIGRCVDGNYVALSHHDMAIAESHPRDIEIFWEAQRGHIFLSWINDFYTLDAWDDTLAFTSGKLGIEVTTATGHYFRLNSLDIRAFPTEAINIANIVQIPCSDLFMDVIAVSATHVRSNEDLSATVPITYTLDAQPDVPRTLSGHFDTHTNITAYTIDIVGVDAKGNIITETITDANGWDWETSNAFATITSIIMSARTGTGATDTMDIGITDVLGLSNTIGGTENVFKIKKNTANATVADAQANTTYDTYDMSVITLGNGDDFTIWYKSTMNIAS